MEKNKIKFLAIAIVGLFMVLSFSPTTTAVKNKNVLDLIEVEVTDYKSDGTKDTRTVLLEKSAIKDLKDRFLGAESLSEKLEVLKDFDLVSKDTSVQDWFSGMLDIANDLGIKNRNRLTRTKIKLPFMISALNKVSSVSIVGGSKRIGFTPLFRIIKKIFNLDKVTRADLLVTQSGLVSILDTKSVLSKNTMITLLGFTGHVGFVGTGIKIPFLMHIYLGHSALSFGMGLGFRVKRSNLNDII